MLRRMKQTWGIVETTFRWGVKLFIKNSKKKGVSRDYVSRPVVVLHDEYKDLLTQDNISSSDL